MIDMIVRALAAYGGITPQRLRESFSTPDQDPYRWLIGGLFVVLFLDIIALVALIAVPEVAAP